MFGVHAHVPCFDDAPKDGCKKKHVTPVKTSKKAMKAMKAMKAKPVPAAMKVMKAKPVPNALCLSALKAAIKVTKSSRAGASVREGGLSMVPRFVASRLYYKVRKEHLAQKCAEKGLNFADATPAQKAAWDRVARRKARLAHAECIENMETENLD